MLRIQKEGRGADVDESGLSAELASTKRALSSAEESVQALRIKIGELQDENGALRVRLRVDSAYAALHLDMFPSPSIALACATRPCLSTDTCAASLLGNAPQRAT
jgi:hypothetical protein